MGSVEARAEESAEHVGASNKEAYVGAALGRAHRHEGGIKSPFRRHKAARKEKKATRPKSRYPHETRSLHPRKLTDDELMQEYNANNTATPNRPFGREQRNKKVYAELQRRGYEIDYGQ